MKSVGIDLGTTNSLISVYDDKKPQLIPNALGSFLTPSVVSVTKDGSILVGASARERLISAPNDSVHAFKRMMGTNKTFTLRGKRFRPEELSALVLKQLKEDAEEFLKEEVSEAVISVPAYFNDSQRTATKNAASLAGLKVTRLINEPTAAALLYGLHEKENERKFLILDLGGGTLDVTILELFDGVFEVHASSGDNQLGGEDFTSILVKWIKERASKENITLSDSFIYQQAENAKIGLSVSKEVTIPLGDSKSISLNRDEFNNLCSDLIDRIRGPIVKATKDAGLRIETLDEIILVGGATRMPVIRQFVTRMFGKFPLSKENPDYAVALGCSIQAALMRRGEGLEEIVLTDVMPYSLGIAIHNPSNPKKMYFSSIIDRNRTIPISRVETYVPVEENQRKITIEIYQGESAYVDNNLFLGKLESNFLDPTQKNSVDVRFTYDNSGILEVIAVSNVDGIKSEMVIQQNENKLSEKEVQDCLKRLSELKIHPREQQHNITLLEKANRMFEQSLGSTRNYITEQIRIFENALATQDNNEISRARKIFSQKLEELESSDWGDVA